MKADHAPGGARVWDLPVRVFHWCLVACFAAAWLTRGAQHVDLHAAAGYSFCALLLFRVAWGFIGSGPARFRSFVARPAAALRYLRQTWANEAPIYVSHNPAGAWSVLLFIGLGLGQSGTGLLLLSAQHGYGPASQQVDVALAPLLHRVHESLAWALVVLVALHLAGVWVGSRAHGENLVAAMLTGRKRQVPAQCPSVPARGAVASAMLAALLLAGATYLERTGWSEGYAALRREAKSAPPAAGESWREECGSCHLAYPPELLPARSWARLLGEQDSHFGEDLALGPAALDDLRASAAAADQAPRWAGRMLRSSVAAAAAPLRISETPFWRERHEDIDAARFNAAEVLGRHNCDACHADAASAIFAPRLIHLPE